MQYDEGNHEFVPAWTVLIYVTGKGLTFSFMAAAYEAKEAQMFGLRRLEHMAMTGRVDVRPKRDKNGDQLQVAVPA